jgi:hypothetical protein
MTELIALKVSDVVKYINVILEGDEICFVFLPQITTKIMDGYGNKVYVLDGCGEFHSKMITIASSFQEACDYFFVANNFVRVWAWRYINSPEINPYYQMDHKSQQRVHYDFFAPGNPHQLQIRSFPLSELGGLSKVMEPLEDRIRQLEKEVEIKSLENALIKNSTLPPIPPEIFRLIQDQL